MSSTAPIRLTVIPAIRYANADRAITWLKDTLGFEERALYRNPAGVVEHAELTLGNGMIMIGTAGLNPGLTQWSVQPQAAGGVTSSFYLVVPDCTPVYAQAQAAGAHILTPLEHKDYGGQAFALRDPEGQVWSVGEYDPFAPQPAG